MPSPNLQFKPNAPDTEAETLVGEGTLGPYAMQAPNGRSCRGRTMAVVATGAQYTGIYVEGTLDPDNVNAWDNVWDDNAFQQVSGMVTGTRYIRLGCDYSHIRVRTGGGDGTSQVEVLFGPANGSGF